MTYFQIQESIGYNELKSDPLKGYYHCNHIRCTVSVITCMHVPC